MRYRAASSTTPRHATILLAAVTLVAACSQATVAESVPESTTLELPASTQSLAPTSEAVAETPQPSAPTQVPPELAAFAIDSVLLDGVSYSVAVADTGELRRQGLMGVTDLGSLDGMLFVFSDDTTGGFWMKDTLIPLDIAFFTVDGTFVDGFTMEPCTTATCPTYRPGGEYRFALELPAGNMPGSVERLEL